MDFERIEKFGQILAQSTIFKKFSTLCHVGLEVAGT